jgi:hypothetical protein
MHYLQATRTLTRKKGAAAEASVACRATLDEPTAGSAASGTAAGSRNQPAGLVDQSSELAATAARRHVTANIA